MIGPNQHHLKSERAKHFLGLVIAMMVLLLVCVSATAAASQDEQPTSAGGGDWELTTLPDQVPPDSDSPSVNIEQLISTPSGALYVRTGPDSRSGAIPRCCQSMRNFWRSGDAGTTWLLISPPARGDASDFEPYIVAVDPTDEQILYASGKTALYKSTDGTATWRRVLAFPKEAGGQGGRVQTLGVSAADHNVLYATILGPFSEDFYLLRSRDGGENWTQLSEFHATLCDTVTRILLPHPRDTNRVFLTAGCYAGRTSGDVLDQSTDQGATWSHMFRAQNTYPDYLVSGADDPPSRFYVGTNRDFRFGGSSLFRSDDDGQSWTEVLAYRGGGSASGTGLEIYPDRPNIQVRGLAYDPAQPDRVYVGVTREASLAHCCDRTLLSSGVMVTSDGGETWSELGRQDLGWISDLVLSNDGEALFAATINGVWRLRLQPNTLVQPPSKPQRTEQPPGK